MKIASVVGSAASGEKSISASRSLMWLSFGIMIGLWLAIVAAIFADRLNFIKTGIKWESFEGAMTWGRDLFFICVLPYIGGKFSEAVLKRPASLPAAVQVTDSDVTVDSQASKPARQAGKRSASSAPKVRKPEESGE